MADIIQASHVCKSWRYALSCPQLWKYFVFSLNSDNCLVPVATPSDHCTIPLLATRHKMSAFNDLSTSSIIILNHDTGILEQKHILDVTDTIRPKSETNDKFSKISPSPSLNHANGFVPKSKIHLSDDFMKTFIARNFRLIQHFNAPHRDLEDDNLKKYLPFLPSITFMDLTGCLDISPLALIILLPTYCPLIKCLNLSHTLIDDAAILTLAKGLKNLVDLDISKCVLLTDAGILSLCGLDSFRKRIKRLSIAFCPSLTHHGFEQCLKSLFFKENSDTDYAQDNSFLSSAIHASLDKNTPEIYTKLEYLNLSSNPQISFTHLELLARLWKQNMSREHFNIHKIEIIARNIGPLTIEEVTHCLRIATKPMHSGENDAELSGRFKIVHNAVLQDYSEKSIRDYVTWLTSSDN